MKDNNSEEIDLVELFKLIGNTFNKFFVFIRNILKKAFHFFILFLEFIRIHFFKFIIAIFLGLAIGGYLDYTSQPLYRSSMIVEPNFSSAQQLYNNIEFYNQLAQQEDHETLAEALYIGKKEASSIKKMSIESFSDQTQRIKQFSSFISELDSISQKKVDYNDFLENFNNINGRFHKIKIEATSSEIAKKCQKAIVTSIENNEYFTLQKRINDHNIALKDSIIAKQQEEINQLQEFYKKIKIIEAQKSGAGTNINLAESQQDQISGIELLNQARKLKDEKIELNNEKANTKNTINIISEFPNKGVLVNDFLDKKMVQLPIILFMVIFLVLMLLHLNTFLKNYEK